MIKTRFGLAVLIVGTSALSAFSWSRMTAVQEPAAGSDEIVFHTFSIAAIDPATGVLWQELESRGLADRIRRELLKLTAIRR